MSTQKQTIHEVETWKHKALVSWYIAKFAARLLWRGVIHDASKFLSDEATGFQHIINVLQKHPFGSPEYDQAISTGCVQLHYKRNPHHPQHHPDGIAGMSLLDVVEMVCDWQAAHYCMFKTGQVTSSEVDHNYHRFGDCSLWAAIRNTLDLKRKDTV